MPQPFEASFQTVTEVQFAKDCAIADWNLRRASFAAFVCNQFEELFSEDITEARLKIADAISEEKGEIRARDFMERETGNKIEIYDEFPRLSFKHPYDEIPTEEMFALATQQILDFARLTFSQSRFSRQREEFDSNKGAIFEVLNRYQLSMYDKTPFKGLGIIFRTVIVRIVDTFRLLRERGLREELWKTIESQLDHLIARDEKVLNSDQFRELTESWNDATLIYIAENFGSPVRETLKNGVVPEQLGIPALNWFPDLPPSLKAEALRRGEAEKAEFTITDPSLFEEIKSITDYRERIIKIVVNLASDSHLGIGYLSNSSNALHMHEFYSKGKKRMSDNYKTLEKSLQKKQGSKCRTKIQGCDIHMADAILKSWIEEGIDLGDRF